MLCLFHWRISLSLCFPLLVLLLLLLFSPVFVVVSMLSLLVVVMSLGPCCCSLCLCHSLLLIIIMIVFYRASDFNQALSSWDVSSVTDMRYSESVIVLSLPLV